MAAAISPSTQASSPSTQAPSPLTQASNAKFVVLYSYITFFAVIYGVAWAHVPTMIGMGWETCQGCSSRFWCLIAVHLYEVPILGYATFLGWYGLKRFTAATVARYRSLLLFSIIFNSALATFETIATQQSLKQHWATWEQMALLSLCGLLIGGIALTVYLYQRLLPVD